MKWAPRRADRDLNMNTSSHVPWLLQQKTLADRNPATEDVPSETEITAHVVDLSWTEHLPSSSDISRDSEVTERSSDTGRLETIAAIDDEGNNSEQAVPG